MKRRNSIPMLIYIIEDNISIKKKLKEYFKTINDLRWANNNYNKKKNTHRYRLKESMRYKKIDTNAIQKKWDTRHKKKLFVSILFIFFHKKSHKTKHQLMQFLTWKTNSLLKKEGAFNFNIVLIWFYKYWSESYKHIKLI